jgi:ectoine hydroxylase-related dioxygenase (phytanoyl-CoA dioxygenase family)
MKRDLLSKPNARDNSVAVEWEGDNQQWWNSYMASADNDIVMAGNSAEEPPNAADADVSLPAPNELRRELTASYLLEPAAIQQFNRDGYVKLKGVLSAGALALLREEMTASLVAELGEDPGLDFRSGEMMWLTNETFRQFVLSPRIAEIAAALLQVSSVRLYHDNALAKEPGCGRTPWHCDRDHFPIASPNICTAWMPLQAIPPSMGPLAFAVGMEAYRHVADLPFNEFDTRYDRAVATSLAEHEIKTDGGAFELGEISFHHAYSFHTAGPNHTQDSRMVLATTYFEDGARVIEAPTMISGDWRKFMPGVEAGELIASPYNPVCFPLGN